MEDVGPVLELQKHKKMGFLQEKFARHLDAI